METSVGTYGSVRYTVDVCYWECLLMKSPLYRRDARPSSLSEGAGPARPDLQAIV